MFQHVFTFYNLCIYIYRYIFFVLNYTLQSYVYLDIYDHVYIYNYIHIYEIYSHLKGLVLAVETNSGHITTDQSTHWLPHVWFIDRTLAGPVWKIHPGKLTFWTFLNPKSWRFGSDDFLNSIGWFLASSRWFSVWCVMPMIFFHTKTINLAS